MRLNDYDKLKKARVVKSNNASKYGYVDVIVTADTETSKFVNYTDEGMVSNTSYGWIYEWAINCGGCLFHGRTPSEMVDCIERLCEFYEISKNRKLIIFFHNLSYDYAYLNLFLASKFGETASILGDSCRRVFSVEYGNGLILRDTFKLVNSSLAKWCKNLYLPKSYSKASPIDYNVVRHQSSPLTRKDVHYMLMDVVSLYKCVETYNKDGGYNLATMPITQTSAVRKIVRAKFKKSVKEMSLFKASRYDAETYLHLNRLMAGGLTHGNRDLLGKTVVCYRTEEEKKRLMLHYGKEATYIKGKIKHFDFRSDYPSQQRTEMFPRRITKMPFTDIDSLKRHISTVRKASKTTYSFDLMIKDIVVRKGVSLPYLQFSKIEMERGSIPYYILDNGRVLKYQGIFKISLTLDEFRIIQRQYDVKGFRILGIYEYRLAPMPSFMVESIDEFFFNKTKYKDVAKKLEKTLGKDNAETIDALKKLMRSKEMLNSIYGMTASRYIHPQITFNAEFNKWHISESTDIEAELERYYNGKSNFARYEYGCFTTFYARMELLRFHELIEKKGGIFLYADTDSIFYIDTLEDDAEKEIDKVNKWLRERSDSLGAFIEYEGKRVHYNQFESEKEDIEAFRFLHAKCYIYIEKDGQKNITIAGVKGNNVDKWEALGRDINNLKDGYVIKGQCAGLLTTYIDNDISVDEYGNIYGNSAILTDKTYTLKDADVEEDYINFYY